MDQLILKADINQCEFSGQINAGEVEARTLTVEMCDRLCSCAMAFVTFELADGTVYESKVEDGKAKLPVFAKSQFIKVGLYSADIEDSKCVKRYSPKPANAYVSVGSYNENTTEPPLPTPGDYAELLERIEDIENTGGGSGDGCGITVVDELDVEKEYGEKEVPSMNNFATNMSVLSEISASLKDVEKLKQKDIELSDRIDQHYLDATAHIGEVANSVNGKQSILISGENIKTINGESILGMGNLSVSGGGGSAEEWEPILASTSNNASGLVNICNFEGAYVEGNTPRVKIPALGTVKVVFNLPVKFKKIFVVMSSDSTPICTSGNVKLSWGEANSNWHHFTELAGGNAWSGASWHAEFKKGCVIHWYNSAGFKNVSRSYGMQLFDGTNRLTLSVVSADATFNDINIEIWGVRA